MQRRSKHVAIIGGVRFDTDVALPEGFELRTDSKRHSPEWEHNFGGSAARTAQVVAKLGGVSAELLCKTAKDAVGKLFDAEMRSSGIKLRHEYRVSQFPSSVVLLSEGKRAAILCDRPGDNEIHWDQFPTLDLSKCDAVYFDGRLPLAALAHAKEARARGVLTVLDGCAGRANTDELLRYSNVAIVSELLCKERGLNPLQMLEALQSFGCAIGAVTLSEFGLVWYDSHFLGGKIQYLPALAVPRVVNVNGAGDVFHAAYLWSRVTRHELSTAEHFRFASAAAAHAVQHLGNERRHPTLDDVEAALVLPESTRSPEWWLHS